MERIPTTFKGRIFLSILCLIIFTSMAFLSFFVFRSGAIVREKLRDRGILVVKDLTVISERHLTSRDEAALHQELLNMMGRESDVLYAFVYDKEGNLITSEKKTQIDNTLNKDMQRVAQERGIWIGLIPTKTGKVYDFVSPIVGARLIESYAKDKIVGYVRIGLSLSSVYAERRVAISVGSLIVLCLIGVGFLLSNIVASRISEPTTDLAKVIADVESGNFTTQTSFEGGNDEIGRLGAGINKMIKRLDDLVKAERRRKEEEIVRLKEIARLEKYNEEILENLKSGIVVTDEKLNVLTWNNYMVRNYGIKKEEVLGKNFLECFPKLKEEGFDKIFARVLKGKPYRDYTKKHETKRKGIRYFNVAFTPRKDEDHKINGILMNWDDVTERKQAEEKLQVERNKLQSVVDAMEYGLTIQDLDYNIIYQNQVLRNIFGGLGEKCYRVYESKDKVCDGCPVEMAFQDGKSHTSERRIVMPSGEIAFWENTANPVRDASGKIVSCLEIARNITERKLAEEELTEKKKYLRALFESVADAVVSLDNKNRIVEWNKAAEKMFGYRKEEVVGKNIDDVIAPGEKHDEAVSMTKQILSSKEILGFETTRYRKDGIPIEVMVSGAPIISDGKVTGGVAVYKNITAKKVLERQLKEAAQTLEKKVNERTKELKQAYEQLQRAQEELVRKERLAVLGQLAGGVGHELRNPLGVIKNAAYFLNMKLTDAEDKVKKHLGIIDREIFTANEIITNLLDFSRVKPPQRASVNINKLIKEVLAKSYIPSDIKTVIEIPKDIPSVRVDSGQIERVLLNIVTNAVQAMHESGELKIRGEGVNGFVSIDISDTGEGIPEEVMSKMFQPLFTTKAKGIGLGLTVCKSLLEANGGKISVKSELNKGTTVSVKLPLN